MDLTLTGKCLGVKSETRQGPRGPFESVEFVIQSGDGIDTTVERCGAGFDLRATDYPREGEDVTLKVRPRAFKMRDGGTGVTLDVVGNVRGGARVASVPAPPKVG